MFKYKKAIYSRQLTSAYRAIVKDGITMAHFEQGIRLLTENMELLFNSLKDMEDFEEIIRKIVDENETYENIIKEAKDYSLQSGSAVKDSKSTLIAKFSSITLSSSDEKQPVFKPKKSVLDESIRSLRSIFSMDKNYFKSNIAMDPEKEDQVLPLLMDNMKYILEIHVANVSGTITHQWLISERASP